MFTWFKRTYPYVHLTVVIVVVVLASSKKNEKTPPRPRLGIAWDLLRPLPVVWEAPRTVPRGPALVSTQRCSFPQRYVLRGHEELTHAAQAKGVHEVQEIRQVHLNMSVERAAKTILYIRLSTVILSLLYI